MYLNVKNQQLHLCYSKENYQFEKNNRKQMKKLVINFENYCKIIYNRLLTNKIISNELKIGAFLFQNVFHVAKSLADFNIQTLIAILISTIIKKVDYYFFAIKSCFEFP